ncbi:tetratricopeptide repeat protein [Actinomadura sp. J1-007]|nr:tetratricopeptide repeat protein [Actinomadura sp. J1-007]
MHSQRQRVFEVVDIRVGGFGVVYIVRNLGDSGTRLALKTFNASYLWSDDDRRRFEREAATWISLQPHRNVVTATSVDLIEGFPCLEMEYVDGGDLSALLAAGPLKAERAVRLGIQFCDGMGHASRQLGLVHRDVKPANCLLTSDGTLKVTDFGLARAFDRPADAAHTGVPAGAAAFVTTVIGTPAYMAPEQFRPGQRLDTRTDIYAFGVMLHQMLTGELLAAGHAPRRQRWWRKREARLARIIGDCTAPRREDRPATFADVRAELEEVFPASAGPAAVPPSAAMLCERAIGQRHLGLHRQALATAEEGLRTVGDGERVMRGHLWQVKGLAHVDLGQYDDAVVAQDKAIELNPDEYSAWVCKGAALEKLSRSSEALACYDRAVELAPDEAYGWRGRASALLRLRRYKDGLVACERAAAIAPNDEEVLYFWAVTLRKLGRQDEALGIVERLLAVSPRYSQGWIEKANLLCVTGRADEAIICADRAAEIAPDDPVVLNNRGITLEKLRRFDEALACYDRVLRNEPDNGVSWHRRGAVLRELGRFEEALDGFARATDLAPREADVWCDRGVTMERLGRYEEALACYDRMAELAPDDGWAWFNRGVTLEKLDRLPEALASLEQAVRTAPDNATAAKARDRVQSKQ